MHVATRVEQWRHVLAQITGQSVEIGLRYFENIFVSYIAARQSADCKGLQKPLTYFAILTQK